MYIYVYVYLGKLSEQVRIWLLTFLDGPIVLGASPSDWKQMAAAYPTMPTHAVPKAYRRFFSNTNLGAFPPYIHRIPQAPPTQEEPRYYVRVRNNQP